jgi:hypothetical protein
LFVVYRIIIADGGFPAEEEWIPGSWEMRRETVFAGISLVYGAKTMLV